MNMLEEWSYLWFMTYFYLHTNIINLNLSLNVLKFILDFSPHFLSKKKKLTRMSWTRLPAKLKLEVLRYHLTSTENIDHSQHLDNLVFGDLEVLISTQNTDLVQLSLEACRSSDRPLSSHP